ncbi:HAD family hydrolase [Roseiflexus castenholzii]|jgi:putative hydrolase of the HAD superfamily|uniref:HAD-superfamily hydrolase, subfamily IA, variant 1 n=1 Tax=Roseiflexus castenholzii (strain DSM 13941 / HLO8) TaxID=383372 RepID=A7NR29_ROSCS|nr:HAD family hydrolase [Roseiflexus castenholzii]ABU60025.1 HAD-superfamily hydrolase, subfamily IA, variant 1 [Roseiflexus castenholzii DSM 13941]
MLRAILFDLDDTLYDLKAHWLACLRIALADAPCTISCDLETLVQHAFTMKIWINQLPDFLRDQGMTDQRMIDRAFARYRDIWFETLTLDPEALPLLTALGARYRLGLITNGPSWSQRPKIERFDLASYMHAIIVSEEVGVAKPDPQIFHIALHALGITPDEALFVGDSPENDLRGAAQAGMPAIWVNRHGVTLPPDVPPPVAVVDGLRDLLAIIAAYDSH